MNDGGICERQQKWCKLRKFQAPTVFAKEKIKRLRTKDAKIISKILLKYQARLLLYHTFITHISERVALNHLV
jgi:hypothetical protein